MRGAGDRSRRKSYDTFTPIGPWMTTADEVPDAGNLDVRLELSGVPKQAANTRDLLMKIPEIVAYASGIMRLEPGDVILTGAPPGVGQVQEGDIMDTWIQGLGRMQVRVEVSATD